MIRTFLNKTPRYGERVMIDHSAIVIGDVILEDDVSIWPYATIRGDVNSIHIGARSNIQDQVVIHVTHKSDEFPLGFTVEIGEEVTVGHGAILHGCQINNRCLIGMGAILLDGVIVEEQVLVAAGSVVTPNKRLQSGFIYGGNPARMMRALTEREIKFFQESALGYVVLKEGYMA